VDAVINTPRNCDAEEIVKIWFVQHLTIRELDEMVMSAIGYRGTSPMHGKTLSVSGLSPLGWRPRFSPKAGIESSCLGLTNSLCIWGSCRTRFVNQSSYRAFGQGRNALDYGVLFLICRYTLREGVIVVVEVEARSKMRFDDETALEAVSRRFDWIPSWS
jgi:hypothetical protein